MTKISLLGSTGNVGVQTLEVASHLGIEVVALTCNKNVDLLEKQVRIYSPELVCVFDESAFKKAKLCLSDCSCKVVCGMEGLCEAASLSAANLVFNAIVGTNGLQPTFAALECGKNVAMANKESIVIGGKQLMNCAKQHGCRILPVDSEHSAIFQCIEQHNVNHISKLILTASGGPFLGYTRESLTNVSVAQTLSHPKWKMGRKISVDSATLMNKGLELIEACYLFNKKPEEVEIVIHPQAVLHSAVSYCDGAVIGQFGSTDMRLPIQYALTYPSRVESLAHSFSFLNCSGLTFLEPDYETFGCLDVCVKAAKLGGFAPVVVHAANEQAVDLFLHGKIKFLQIEELVRLAFYEFRFEQEFSISTVLEIIKLVKNFVNSKVM